MTLKNRRIRIREIPTGKLGLEHFVMDEVDVPEPGPDEVLVRTLLLSQDAASRAWMQGATYRAAVNAGDVMASGGIAEVVSSNADGLAPGDIVWARACPDGVDVYFDNTGGDILQAALFAMNRKGRVACCGAVSAYDSGKPQPGPVGIPGLIVVKRLRLEGFIVFDFEHLDRDAELDLSTWAAQGRLKVVEDVLEGLERAPEGLVGLLAGKNLGKRMIRVAPDPA
jgi:NADPH-dependent curcumin reductase CurA